MAKKQTHWDKLMRLNQNIARLDRVIQNASLRLEKIRSVVAQLVSSERERMRREKQDANNG